ncbi:hypothetical protein GT037_007201 [Alternaria burnsii]|uniref:Uncharacterized protein n=1 Tax=Alternaria burnsii TaxID=1187904 RepID=A0A8H7EDS3_9PLEO|nr:uncharacterized protein GT037_007201 [Alternaria burnsii]KAF7674441.1 hypothetical protein GT037_007201 [Alternaria burnsii]
MNPPLSSTDHRRYSAVKLWIYGASNSDEDSYLLSLTDVPLSSVQQLIAESGSSSTGPRPLQNNANEQTHPAANSSSTSERSMIRNHSHRSTAISSDERIRADRGFYGKHCKQCFESGFRASSKKPIRTHLKKYHAEEFRNPLAHQGSRDQYCCCETGFDIESWADHFVKCHYHSTDRAAAPVPLSPTRSSSSFHYMSVSASSSTQNGKDNPYQVAIGSGTSGHADVSNAESQRQTSYRDQDPLQPINSPRSFEKSATSISQSRPPSVSSYHLRTLTPITPSIGVYDRQILPSEDAFGNALFDDHGNKVVRTYDWQQIFVLDGTGNLVCDSLGVPIPVSFGQLLYAYPDSSDILTYRYGVDVL